MPLRTDTCTSLEKPPTRGDNLVFLVDIPVLAVFFDTGNALGKTAGSFVHAGDHPAVPGGTVVLSKRNAGPGDWVNIYVTPDKGS